jgi:hypothetical protein
MESTKVFSQFMSIFCITHMIEDILAKALVECISCLCIPSVVLLLVTNGVSGILDFRKPFDGGSKTPDIYGSRYASMWIFQYGKSSPSKMGGGPSPLDILL